MCRPYLRAESSGPVSSHRAQAGGDELLAVSDPLLVLSDSLLAASDSLLVASDPLHAASHPLHAADDQLQVADRRIQRSVPGGSDGHRCPTLTRPYDGERIQLRLGPPKGPEP